jgi:hypothetical protein
MFNFQILGWIGASSNCFSDKTFGRWDAHELGIRFAICLEISFNKQITILSSRDWCVVQLFLGKNFWTIGRIFLYSQNRKNKTWSMHRPIVCRSMHRPIVSRQKLLDDGILRRPIVSRQKLLDDGKIFCSPKIVLGRFIVQVVQLCCCPKIYETDVMP